MTLNNAPVLSKIDYKILRVNRTRELHLVIGASGAGKTLLMTGKLALTLMRYHIINNLFANYIGSHFFPRPLQVWSNYEVIVPYRAADDGCSWPGANGIVTLKTCPLDVHKLYVFDEEMREGTVFITELDLIADRQDWANGGQKLLMSILRQVRKRHLSLTADIQSLNWLNPRFQFQLDIITHCRDAGVTAWGQENGLEPGEMTFLSTKDMSGRITGYMYEETGQQYECWFRGRQMWNYYNTDEEFNPFDHMESVSIKRKKLELDVNAREELSPVNYENDINIIVGLLEQYVKRGTERVRKNEFIETASSQGLVMDKKELKQYLEQIHNVPEYQATGYTYLNLREAKNLRVRVHRPRKPKPAIIEKRPVGRPRKVLAE